MKQQAIKGLPDRASRVLTLAVGGTPGRPMAGDALDAASRWVDHLDMDTAQEYWASAQEMLDGEAMEEEEPTEVPRAAAMPPPATRSRVPTGPDRGVPPGGHHQGALFGEGAGLTDADAELNRLRTLAGGAVARTGRVEQQALLQAPLAEGGLHIEEKKHYLPASLPIYLPFSLPAWDGNVRFGHVGWKARPLKARPFHFWFDPKDFGSEFAVPLRTSRADADDEETSNAEETRRMHGPGPLHEGPTQNRMSTKSRKWKKVRKRRRRRKMNRTRRRQRRKRNKKQEPAPRLSKQALNDHTRFVQEACDKKLTQDQVEDAMRKTSPKTQMSLWKAFEADRVASGEQEQYVKAAAGPGNQKRKRKMLGGWILDGGRCTKHYKQAIQLYQIGARSGCQWLWLSRTEAERRIGPEELKARVNRGHHQVPTKSRRWKVLAIPVPRVLKVIFLV